MKAKDAKDKVMVTLEAAIAGHPKARRVPVSTVAQEAIARVEEEVKAKLTKGAEEKGGKAVKKVKKGKVTAMMLYLLDNKEKGVRGWAEEDAETQEFYREAAASAQEEVKEGDEKPDEDKVTTKKNRGLGEEKAEGNSAGGRAGSPEEEDTQDTLKDEESQEPAAGDEKMEENEEEDTLKDDASQEEPFPATQKLESGSEADDGEVGEDPTKEFCEKWGVGPEAVEDMKRMLTEGGVARGAKRPAEVRVGGDAKRGIGRVEAEGPSREEPREPDSEEWKPEDGYAAPPGTQVLKFPKEETVENFHRTLGKIGFEAGANAKGHPGVPAVTTMWGTINWYRQSDGRLRLDGKSPDRLLDELRKVFPPYLEEDAMYWAAGRGRGPAPKQVEHLLVKKGN